MHTNPITKMGSPMRNMQSCLLFVSGLAAFLGLVTVHDTALFNRSIFPVGFIFGTASSAYQYEGAANEGGKGPSIWDTFSHNYPDHIKDGSNGDVAVDSYHRYEEDIKLMAEIGVDAYRLSLSWSRILPGGGLSGGVNKEGIDYYNKVIDMLLLNGIKPSVTLFHWDVPQELEDEYGGFLSPRIVEDFREYANICFKEFGDRVKHWITVNEPWSFSTGGYAGGVLKLAPGRCSDWQQLDCKGGDSATEPYVVSHHQLLAHAAAVKLYREKYKSAQKGVIGIALMSFWMEPLSDAKHDQDAAKRALDYMLGWFMGPLTNGDYPDSMRSLAGSRLPKFLEKESEIVKGSIDFLGLNYYTTYYASDVSLSDTTPLSFLTDSHAELAAERDGIPIGPQSASGWLYVYPQGLRELLLYTKTKYNNPVIYITENGVDEYNDNTISLNEALTDNMRIDYLYQHLSYLLGAMKDGVNVKGYFVWSLLDNYEWTAGYTCRFGLHYVDYKDGLKRYPKLSALWFRNFLEPEKKYRLSS